MRDYHINHNSCKISSENSNFNSNMPILESMEKEMKEMKRMMMLMLKNVEELKTEIKELKSLPKQEKKEVKEKKEANNTNMLSRLLKINLLSFRPDLYLFCLLSSVYGLYILNLSP
jgi:hypothetical protein